MNLDDLTYEGFAWDLVFVVLIAITLSLCGCAIPVVGNSPEERAHRKQLEEQQKTNETFSPEANQR